MPINVTGTHGKLVSVEVLGVNEVIRKLEALGKDMADGANRGAAQAGAFMSEEVKASIAGQRAETKSVDTGEFIQSVDTKMIDKGIAAVYSDVPQAVFMEYGTSRGIAPRSHFRNSLNRNKTKIFDIIKANTSDKVK